ncbi:YybH family protein [Planococcus maritimus]|uniref:YybH family protein n=1 Tax=Planococcus maritimus TaxID=192421 RepID=UPI00232B76C7|nr:nuclear transport factor 2 family protein [Planococcus maritimus]
MKKWIMATGLILTLAGCSSEEDTTVNSNTAEDGNAATENNAIEHGITDQEVGFTLDDEGDVIAAEVPEEDKQKLLDAYGEYIAAFNAEDMDRYMATIAENPDGFDREEDQQALAEAFDNYDTAYTTSDETIVKYEEDRAEVFATINVEMNESGTDQGMQQSGRQVVVFKKEQGDWKVTSLHFIGNQ